jgi:gluconolactonase
MKFFCCVALAAALGAPAAGQDDRQYVTEKLGTGYRFTEGPAWSKDGFLIFSDTPNDRLWKWVPGRMPEVYREKAHGPSGNAFDAQGRLYTCETRARRVTRTEKTGAIEVIAERWEGKRLNAPAGIVVNKSGHVYFTDPAFGYQSDQRELGFYGVYHIPPKGAMEVIARPSGRPLGIALAPNGRTLYVSNVDEHNIRAYDLDRNGEASNERVLVPAMAETPGGISVDEKGNLYVAVKGLAVYSSQGGLLHRIGLPEQTSNSAFDDAGSKQLFVTSRSMVYRLSPADQ